MKAVTFDKDADIYAELVVYGKLAGWAGTDHLRRDLGIALLWGTPIALAFGLLAALGTSLSQLIIAAVGTWFGGWLDELIQRITEVNLVLPFLPILIMIGTFYSRSIFVILSAVILLSIFGSGIKTYRAVFMQVKESPYIEAARSYGASNYAHHLPVYDPAHDPHADPAVYRSDSQLMCSWKPPWRCLVWATRPCPPGARSSTNPAPTAPCSRAGTTGCWNLPCC